MLHQAWRGLGLGRGRRGDGLLSRLGDAEDVGDAEGLQSREAPGWLEWTDIEACASPSQLRCAHSRRAAWSDGPGRISCASRLISYRPKRESSQFRAYGEELVLRTFNLVVDLVIETLQRRANPLPAQESATGSTRENGTRTWLRLCCSNDPTQARGRGWGLQKLTQARRRPSVR